MLIFTSLIGMSRAHNYIWFCDDTKKHESANHRKKYWSHYVISHDYNDNTYIVYRPSSKYTNWIKTPYKHIKW